jgi:ATP-dependent Clp protease ATP-binding subunit ClpX
MGYRRRVGQIERRCAFCGRPRSAVRKLVAGPGVFICDRCIAVCRRLLADERRQIPPARGALPRPKEIGAQLDEWAVDRSAA